MRHLRSWLVPALSALGACAAFWLPAVPAARGWFPAPLDDVYIHFDYARSLATGHLFEWVPGAGYSSGETAPLYAVVLALGWLFGLRGAWLGAWAAGVAVAGTATLLWAITQLVRRLAHLPGPSAPLVAALPLSLGVLVWTLASGMEMAPFVGLLGVALLALARTRAPRFGRAGATRERAQWRLGVVGAALVLLRPEAAVLVAVFAVFAARGAGARSGALALLRVGTPGALATVLVAGTNRLLTGDARSAGAQLKLLSSNPYLTDEARARAFAENLAALYVKVARSELGLGGLGALAFIALALVGLGSRRARPVTGACLAGALGWVLLVSWNGNAPHHNFRYYAPALVLLATATALGIAEVARRVDLLWPGRGAAVAALATVALAVSPALRWPAQVRHFAAATSNIREQHVELGLRIARLPGARDAVRVLLGDAGAIPFVSERPAIDALGLGGFRGMPFARAAVQGEAATLELLERLAPDERPTHLALYPNWFRGTTTHFGAEIDRVTIAPNVITGGPTKVLYRADWSALGAAPPRPLDDGSLVVVDELDTADVVSERAHAYDSPAPHGGWTTIALLEDPRGERRFDGARILPAGSTSAFTAQAGARGRARVFVRADDRPARLRVRTPREEREVDFPPLRAGAWTDGTADFAELRAGDRIELVVGDQELREAHVWIAEVP